MDPFGRKRIRELEAEIARQDATILQAAIDLKANMGLRTQIEYLVRTIRDMDQQIWKMSQCSDWPSMRPNFVTLQEGMTSRKVAESNRISDLLRPQLIETYASEPATKRIGKS